MLGDGEAIEPDELAACAAANGVTLRAGDIVLVRTGWWRLFGRGPEARQRFYASEPGVSGACSRWFRDHDLVALGADTPAVEAVRSFTDPLPLHRDVLWGCGGYLLEFLDLEALAADNIVEFLFVASPLQIDGGVGSPLTPIAVVRIPTAALVISPLLARLRARFPGVAVRRWLQRRSPPARS